MTERLLPIVNSVAEHPAFDCSAIRFVRPHGAAILVAVCQHVSCLAGGEPVRLINLQPSVFAYLDRIDFFARANADAVHPPLSLSDLWSRNSHSAGLLELMPIRSQSNLNDIMARAQTILARWFSFDSPEYARGVTLLSEACSNIILHSDSKGVAMMQKYSRGDKVEVELAISDVGCGIPQSLRSVHGSVASGCSQYILRAMKGLSARGLEAIGQGLGAIWSAIRLHGGSLLIRSESGRVVARQESCTQVDGLTPFPGTHVAIRLERKVA